jgi:copper chaperone CopZ
VIVKEVDGVMSVEAVPEPDDSEEGWTVRRG